MRGAWTSLACGALVLAAAAGGVALGKQLGAREAREQIAALIGARSDDVRIKSISGGLVGSDNVVEAQVELAFRMTERAGAWRVAEVRLPNGSWEDVDLVRRAIDAEKARVAAADLRELAGGVEAYRRERGFYPETEDFGVLLDAIAPRFMARILRTDPWHQSFYYEPGSGGYRVGSAGPDGARGTADDVVVSSEGKGA